MGGVKTLNEFPIPVWGNFYEKFNGCNLKCKTFSTLR